MAPFETATCTVDVFVSKYNSSGVIQWTRQIGVSAKNTIGNAIAIDSSDNIYLAGTTNGGLDGHALTGTGDMFVIKYDSSGTKISSIQMGVSAKQVNAAALSIDTTDNVHVAGWTTGGFDGNSLTGSQDMFITKFNSSGVRQWTSQNGVAATYTHAWGISVDTVGNVYVAGDTGGNLNSVVKTGSTDSTILKYNSSGVRQWTKLLGATGKSTQSKTIVINSVDELHISGVTTGSLPGNTFAGNEDAFIAKYDSSGTRK